MKHSGHLVIIGGGERPLCVMQKIVELAGGPRSRMVIIPTASDTPEEVADLQKLEFLALGVSHIDIVHCSRETADLEPHLQCIRQATGVFFSGGDQRKLAAALLGTQLLEEIRAVHASGGVIAGTSAGAAVMSRVMITGDETPLTALTEAGVAIGAQSIGTAAGFGFIERAIIDQHFVKRSRHYRLLNLAGQYPELLGIGIDEATAIVVAPDGTFSIMGDSHVLVFDPSGDHERQTGPAPQSNFRNPKVHILSSGKRFCMHRQLVLN